MKNTKNAADPLKRKLAGEMIEPLEKPYLETKGLDPQYKNLYEEAGTVGEAMERFKKVIDVLRVHCPWDKEQTHESLCTCMIEEAYEAVHAIEQADVRNLREELGDVLMQVVLHSRLGEEDGLFDLKDVLNEESDKMIRRHPHVFSGFEAKTVDKVLEKWENVKSKEHGNLSHIQRLRDVPVTFPALMRSQKVQKRAADAGFDWSDITGPISKVVEELQEFEEAFAAGETVHATEELGDLLFAVVNVVRFTGADAESVLQKATEKFIRRFAAMETLAETRGMRLETLNLEEQDALWNEIKRGRAGLKEDNK